MGCLGLGRVGVAATQPLVKHAAWSEGGDDALREDAIAALVFLEGLLSSQLPDFRVICCTNNEGVVNVSSDAAYSTGGVNGVAWLVCVSQKMADILCRC